MRQLIATIAGAPSVLGRSTRADLWSDERVTAVLRVLLAGAAFLVTAGARLDSLPRSGDVLVAVTLYLAYALGLYIAARRHVSFSVSSTHWIDVAWYTLFVLLAGGTSSPFFSFYYFAVLLASFRGGFWPGMRVAIASAVLFSLAAYFGTHTPDELMLERAVLRPSFLLIIGAMMARAGGLELGLKRRLILLREVSALANPRFGAVETVGLIIERLRAFYAADLAVLAIVPDAGGDCSLLRTHPRSHGAMIDSGDGVSASVHLLTDVGWTRGVLFRKDAARCFDVRGDEFTAVSRAPEIDAWSRRVASLLDCRSFVSVPVRYDARSMARLCVTSRDQTAFGAHDLDLLVMVFEHVRPTLERLRILDTIADDAAVTERLRVAHDLHDALIQPWIGLQMGIAAALRRSQADEPVTPVLEHLLALATQELEQLREYSREFGTPGDGHARLADGIRRIAARFAAAADMDVRVDAPDPLPVQDRVAREVFHIVAEGLSNVRRHTEAAHVSIHVHREDQDLHLRIANPGGSDTTEQPFTPRSIQERVARLGGVTTVHADAGTTVVDVRIPL